MHRSVTRWSLAIIVFAIAGCSGDVSAASAPNVSAHFDPPRSLGTPLAEVQRVSGTVLKQKVNRP
jgi:hypothetical protein